MADARGRRITITVEGDGAVFQVSGKTIDFPGYLRAYVEGSDDPEAELADREDVLPAVAVGETLAVPRARSRRATRRSRPTATAKRRSPGRWKRWASAGRAPTPRSSTRSWPASTSSRRATRWCRPGWRSPCRKLLEAHLPDLVDYQFTAEMEDELDAISRGELGHVEYLQGVLFRQRASGPEAAARRTRSTRSTPATSAASSSAQPDGGEPVYVRVGRYGPFLEQGERRASLPERDAARRTDARRRPGDARQGRPGRRAAGHLPRDATSRSSSRSGRFGPYVQRGTAEDEEKPQNASLLKGMKPEDVDLDDGAEAAVAAARRWATIPQSGEPVVAHNGRFGPYVKCGDGDALAAGGALAAGRDARRRRWSCWPSPRAAAARPASQASRSRSSTRRRSPSKPVQLLDGRYGPYVTDGETNASLPRDASPEELTLERALDLLAERAAKAPAKKKAVKKAATKTVTKKKAAKKKTVKKKAAKK